MAFNRLINKPFILLFAVTAFFISGCGAFIFNPQKEFTTDPEIIAATADHEDVFLASSGNVTLHGWLFRAKTPKGIVVFLHGYEDNISTQARNALWLVDAGYDVFAPDYRGHGKSDGSPTLSGINDDGLAAIDEAFRLSAELRHSEEARGTFLALKTNVAHKQRGNLVYAPDPAPKRFICRLAAKGETQRRVFVYGQSMGGAIAVWAVANSPHKDEIAALILDAPFSSYRAIAKESVNRSPTKWPLRYLTFLLDDSFSPTLWIKRVEPVPVLLIHGTQDTINLPYHSQRLYDAAGEPKELWMVEAKGHPTALTDAATQKRLIEYMDVRGRWE